MDFRDYIVILNNLEIMRQPMEEYPAFRNVGPYQIPTPQAYSQPFQHPIPWTPQVYSEPFQHSYEEMTPTDHHRPDNPLDELNSLVSQLAMRQTIEAPETQAPSSCNTCFNPTHPAGACLTLQESTQQPSSQLQTEPTLAELVEQIAANNLEFQQKIESTSFSTQQQIQPPEHQQYEPSVEDLIKQLASSNLQFQQRTESTFQDLQTQIGQLAISLNQVQTQGFICDESGEILKNENSNVVVSDVSGTEAESGIVLDFTYSDNSMNCQCQLQGDGGCPIGDEIETYLKNGNSDADVVSKSTPELSLESDFNSGFAFNSGSHERLHADTILNTLDNDFVIDNIIGLDSIYNPNSDFDSIVSFPGTILAKSQAVELIQPAKALIFVEQPPKGGLKSFLILFSFGAYAFSRKIKSHQIENNFVSGLLSMHSELIRNATTHLIINWKKRKK